MATADSNVKSIICTVNSNGIKALIIFVPVLLNKVNNKWPAIILAVSRIVRVIGRIMLLIDSMHTIKGIRMVGVP